MNELNETNFKEELKKRNLVLVDFYATWCGPCKMQGEILDKLNRSRSLNFDILKVNVDDSPNLAEEYEIESIPTLLAFRGDKLLKRTVGLTNEQDIILMMNEQE